MITDTKLQELVEQVARWALAARYRLVRAESCTDLAGSSRWFECGYVTYSNEAKVRDIGVTQRTLNEHGAVSEATVREMAAGALRVSGADVVVAISGIAGPDGGTPTKPVGTVWFGLATRRGVEVVVTAEMQLFAGDRELVRRRSVKRALELVLAGG